MAPPSSMNLCALQESSEAIQKLLDRLEDPSSAIPELAQARRASATASQSKRDLRAQKEEEEREERRIFRKKGIPIESIKTHAHGDQHAADEDAISEASSDSGFLEFEPPELVGAFDSFNVVGSKRIVDSLLSRVRTEAKFLKTEAIAKWFEEKTKECLQDDADLDTKEEECIKEFNHLGECHDQLFNAIEGRDLNCIQFMRKFYHRVLSLRPDNEAAQRALKAQQNAKKMRRPEEDAASKKKAREKRRHNLEKEVHDDKEAERLKSVQETDEAEQEDEDDGPIILVALATNLKAVTKAQIKAKDKEPLSPKDNRKKEKVAPVGPKIEQDDIASELLEVISAQQDEIAHYRFKVDQDKQATQAMREGLELTRYMREVDDAQRSGNALRSSVGSQPILSETGKGLLAEVQESLRAKCVADMLETPEGRVLLEKGEGKAKIAEMNAKAAEIVKESKALKMKMEELHAQIDAVGDGESRERELRDKLDSANAAKHAKERLSIAKMAAEPSGRRPSKTQLADGRRPSKTQLADLPVPPCPQGKKGKKGKKGLYRSGTVACLEEAPEPEVPSAPCEAEGADDLATLGSKAEDSTSSPKSKAVVVTAPESAWMAKQSKDVQLQLSTAARNMERMVDNIGRLTSQMSTVLEETVQGQVDDALQEEMRESQDIRETEKTDDCTPETEETDKETLFAQRAEETEKLKETEKEISLIKEALPQRRERLNTMREKNLALQQEELEQKQHMRELKKIQKEAKGEKNEEDEEEELARAEGTGSCSPKLFGRNHSAASASEVDGEGAGMGRASPKASVLRKLMSMKSGAFHMGGSAEENETPLSLDASEVQGQVRGLKTDLESLGKKEANIKSKIDVIVRRVLKKHQHKRKHQPADTQHNTEDASASSTAADVAGAADIAGSTATSAGGSGVLGNGAPSPSPGEAKQSQTSANAASQNSNAPSGHVEQGIRELQQTGLEAGAAEGRRTSDGAPMTRRMLLEQQQVDNASRHEMDASGAHQTTTMSSRRPSHQDADGRPISQGHSHDHHEDHSHDAHPEDQVLIDKREEQVKELLFYQNENERLNEQIAGTERQIHEAKERMLHPEKHSSSAPIKVVDQTLPAENKEMRRTVVRNQRELNNLRNKWLHERDAHHKGAYEAHVPGQVEAAVRLLLRKPPKSEDIIAKAEQEAVKRAQVEADKLAEGSGSSSASEEEEDGEKKEHEEKREDGEVISKRMSLEELAEKEKKGTEGLADGESGSRPSLFRNKTWGETGVNEPRHKSLKGNSAIGGQVAAMEALKQVRASEARRKAEASSQDPGIGGSLFKHAISMVKPAAGWKSLSQPSAPENEAALDGILVGAAAAVVGSRKLVEHAATADLEDQVRAAEMKTKSLAVGARPIDQFERVLNATRPSKKNQGERMMQALRGVQKGSAPSSSSTAKGLAASARWQKATHAILAHSPIQTSSSEGFSEGSESGLTSKSDGPNEGCEVVNRSMPLEPAEVVHNAVEGLGDVLQKLSHITHAFDDDLGGTQLVSPPEASSSEAPSPEAPPPKAAVAHGHHATSVAVDALKARLMARKKT